VARFYDSPQWRFVVTNLDSEVQTILDTRAFNRTITRTLNKPAVGTFTCWSDDPYVNIDAAEGTDSDPFVAEGTRILWGFRRETLFPASSLAPVWVCRFGGQIMQIEDIGDDVTARTQVSAFDPWKYLYGRPVQQLDGTLPGENGQSYDDTKGNVIAATLLRNTILNDGEAFIDPGPDYGGTVYWSGTIEDTSQMDINFRQGSSVGEAWDQLIETGTMDIVLNPVWDPLNRPGIIAELSIYNEAGQDQYDAIFSWDKPVRSAAGIQDLVDGTQRANVIQFYTGSTVTAAPRKTSLGSVSKFRAWWAQQAFPGWTVSAAVESLAETQLLLRQYGKQTVTFSPDPERAPPPFNAYDIGDRVQVFASDRLRQELSGLQRVYGIPINIDDTGVERIERLLVSPEG